jgi:putative two-component system response regulator
MTGKPLILVVDDNPTNLEVLSQLLLPSFRVHACKSGEQALVSAGRDPKPDLILLDVMMPGMDGYTVLTRLREDENTCEIPVIFVTALDDDLDEERGLRLGAVDYITKPIRPAIMLARVRAQIELKRGRDQLKDHNAWLESEISRRMRENLLIQDASLCALAELAETRDTDTGNHVLRTQAYVETLARRLQSHPRFAHELDEISLTRIVKAAPLHDIGKIGIPDHILLKPGSFTRDEWEIMKTHSRIGGNTIRRAIDKALAANPAPTKEGKPESLAFLEAAQSIATSHHEKWDGSGYPDALTGDAIPLAARLMALADVFDALTMVRVYKKPWPVREAVDFIVGQKGSHFDPDVVEAFEQSLEEFEGIRTTFSDGLPQH